MPKICRHRTFVKSHVYFHSAMCALLCNALSSNSYVAIYTPLCLFKKKESIVYIKCCLILVSNVSSHAAEWRTLAKTSRHMGVTLKWHLDHLVPTIMQKLRCEITVGLRVRSANVFRIEVWGNHHNLGYEAPTSLRLVFPSFSWKFHFYWVGLIYA